MFLSVERSWRAIRDLWDELVRRGVEPDLLRDRSLVTPHCGLGMHTPAVAERVCATSRQVGRRLAQWEPRAAGRWA
jgi:pentatricopeptide repeat protein